MNLKERLKYFIKYNNLSISAFEKSISASTGYVNNISKSIGTEKLDLIASKYPQLNLSWLTRGEGQMLKEFYFLPIDYEGEKILVYKDDSGEAEIEAQQRELVGNRLNSYAKNKGLTIKNFADKSGIGYNNAASILKGSLPIGMNVLQKIKKGFPDINTDWVLFGYGEMEINTSPVSSTNNKDIERLEQANNLLIGALKDKDKVISSLENQIELLQELKELKSQDESPIKSNMGK